MAPRGAADEFKSLTCNVSISRMQIEGGRVTSRMLQIKNDLSAILCSELCTVFISLVKYVPTKDSAQWGHIPFPNVRIRIHLRFSSSNNTGIHPAYAQSQQQHARKHLSSVVIITQFRTRNRKKTRVPQVESALLANALSAFFARPRPCVYVY